MKREEKETVRNLLIESYIQYQDFVEQDRWEKYLEEVKTAVDNEQIDALLIAKSGDTILGTVQLLPSSDLAYDEATLHIVHTISHFRADHPDGRGVGSASKQL